MTTPTQLCGICLNNEKQIPSNPSSSFHGREVKFLKCNHGFHPKCINRWIYGGASKCPTCKREMIEEELHYDWTSDPVIPQGFAGAYNQRDSRSSKRFVYHEKVSPAMQTFILKHYDEFGKGPSDFKAELHFTPTGGITSLHTTFERGTGVFYCDESGTAHTALEVFYMSGDGVAHRELNEEK